MLFERVRHSGFSAAPKQRHQRDCHVLKELVCSCLEQSWCPVCPLCQISTFLSRGCLLWDVGPGLKPCCPGILGGRRVKGYSCVSCFLLQLLTRASIHQQSLLHCPNPPPPPTCQWISNYWPSWGRIFGWFCLMWQQQVRWSGPSPWLWSVTVPDEKSNMSWCWGHTPPLFIFHIGSELVIPLNSERQPSGGSLWPTLHHTL